MDEPQRVDAGDTQVPRDRVASYTAPATRRRESLHRVFVDGNNVAWMVRECVAPADLCSRGARCLIFEAEGRARRVWTYPPNWRELDEAALTRLSLGT
jgi:hypothetical protein